MSENIEPPKTVKEVGIHIGYMREDMTELKDLVKDIKDGFVPKVDFENYKKYVDGKFKEVARRTWIQNAFSAAGGSVVTVLIIQWVNNLLGKN